MTPGMQLTGASEAPIQRPGENEDREAMIDVDKEYEALLEQAVQLHADLMAIRQTVDDPERRRAAARAYFEQYRQLVNRAELLKATASSEQPKPTEATPEDARA